MKLICTYCSGPKRKDGGLLPAVDRYLSPRIRTLYDQSRDEGVDFRILSGEYGLLPPGQLISWYDHLLQAEEVEELADLATATLERLAFTEIEYHTADPQNVPEVVPYLAVLENACRRVQIELKVLLLSGNPD